MAKNSNMAFFVAMAALALVMNSVGAATTYQVGDGLGWIIPPAGAYATWALNKTFTVGDVLVFTFSNGNHDVAEVTKANYDSCSATSPISLETNSPASLTLSTSGEHYYICTFNGHCSAGQKLSINVTGTSSPAPAPAPSTSSPPPPAAVPAPAPSTSSPPPPASVPAPAPSTSSPPPPPGTVPAPAPSTSSPPPPPGTVPAPGPSTSTTPGSPTSPSSPTSPPPPPSSAATSLKVAGLSATFLSIALALLF